MPISWSLDDYHFEYGVTQAGILPGLSAAGGVLQNWIDDFDYMAETHDWGVITYTFHLVIGRGHHMKILTRLLDHLSAKGAVFMTMGGRRRSTPRPRPMRDLATALKHLATVDPDMARVCASGPPPRTRPATFATLLQIITSQQVSVAAATSIWQRLRAAGFDRPAVFGRR